MGVKLVPLTSASQQSVEKAVSDYLRQYIGQGATAYPGQLTADVPELFTEAYGAYERDFGGGLGELSSATIRSMISGEPAYQFDPAAVTERWKETYAGPLMQTWEQSVLPSIKEGFNIPGVAYSRGRGREVGRAASDFYGQYVAPTLFSALQTGQQMGFQSAEAAAGRVPGALALPGQQFAQAATIAGSFQEQQQRALSASYQEFLRTQAEPGWAVQSALGYMTQPTMDAFYKESGAGGGMDWLGIGAGAGVGTLMGAGGMLGGLTGTGGAALGALMMMSDVRVKENIKPMTSALDRIAELQGHMFDFVGNDKGRAGIMAQDVERIMPEAVVEINGIKHIDVSAILALLVNAVNELRELEVT